MMVTSQVCYPSIMFPGFYDSRNVGVSTLRALPQYKLDVYLTITSEMEAQWGETGTN